ncbi:XRE family transcriptional regulator [Streptomyces sp. NBC_00091]|uniref:XRE family transcriptional regulator n=1 Tax=Streptomyces sp. NBC_00091 TaxID=2975648 RepID=UPI002258CD2D|nr:XRE family transcriptional regulator [Streptomyces sp. NBC_00091]MCX5381076.1 XRE family transcriptional regulator [Streptomyces sp. NBC_00091]
MAVNAVLKQKMHDLALTQDELAAQMNVALLEITGRPGDISVRTVRNLLSGATQRPIGRTRKALEQVFGCPLRDLGFEARSTASPPEDPVKRRHFITAGTALAFSSAHPALATPRRIGSSDVEGLQRRFADIIASDHRHGGQLGIEQKAAALSDEALVLQSTGTASQRIRGQVYASAAAFRSSAMWAAIDGRRFEDAIGHMQVAQQLAEMSGDPFIKFRIWSHAGTMYRHMGRAGDAAAANEVARGLSITRRDPMFASLGLARHAAIHGSAGDRTATRRAFDHAQDAMLRADHGAQRPVWMNAFYDQAELDSLALSAYLTLGDFARAEFHGHRCLAGLRPHMHRSKAIATARVALAQLEQGDVEPAVASAMSVPVDQAVRHPRVVGMLRTFSSRLDFMAQNTAAAQTWNQYARDTWRSIA